MNIVFFAPRFHTNQVEVVKALQSDGHVVEFHVTKISVVEDHKAIRPELVPLSRLSALSNYFAGGSSNYLLISSVKYFLALKAKSVDLIIIRDPVSLTPILAALIGRVLRIKILFYTQVRIIDKKGILRRVFYKSLMFFFQARWYSPVIGSDSFVVRSDLRDLYYLPFPTEVLRCSSLNFFNGVCNILAVGKYQTRKNHLLLLRAINILKHQFDFQLTVIGECSNLEHLGIYRELESFVEENNLKGVVTLYRNISPQEMARFFSDSNIFVLASYNEPASISILEAMSFSIPVVVSDDCGNRDFVLNNITGFHFKRNSLLDLTLKLSHLLSEMELFQKMVKETEVRTKENFSYSFFLRQFYRILGGRN